MWNKAKCILLETKENSGLLLGLSKFGRLISYDTKYVNLDNDVYNAKQHLYIINDDIIKVNDWYLATDKIEQCFSKEEANDLTSNCKKIIATTNKSLQIKSNHLVKDRYALLESLPQIPQSFIEQYITEYNQGKIISDVLVEYDEEELYTRDIPRAGLKPENRDMWYSLKINQNYGINIKTVKDSFSREDVEVLLFNLAEHYGMTSAKSEIDDFNIWISENL